MTTRIQDPTSPLYRTRPAASASLSLLPASRSVPGRPPAAPPGATTFTTRAPAGRALSHRPAPRSPPAFGGGMPDRASQAPPGPTCEASESSARRLANARSHGRKAEKGRRKRGVCSTDQRKKAAKARGLRDNSVQDLAPPPPLRRHQPRRRRKRSSNTRTPRHQRKSAPAIVQGTAAECRNIAQLLRQVRLPS